MTAAGARVIRRTPLVVLGNPENRRVQWFAAAARREGWAVETVAYEELLSTAERAAFLAERVPPGAVVRIESPGESALVESRLIRLGAMGFAAREADVENAAQAAHDHGRIAAPRWWFAGYRRLLAELEAALAPRGVVWFNHPDEIPVLFDKTACHERLRAAGVPVPPALSERSEAATDYETLRRQLRAAGWRRVFVKLRYGSSASGVAALEWGRAGVQATTSVELVRVAGVVRLYNSLRVRRYRDEREVAALVDELARHEVQVERWLPKAGFQGRSCDLRVLMIAGKARQRVLRTSRGPITNLHLGNRRGDWPAFLAQLPPSAAAAAWASCQAAAEQFPRSLYLGVDLLFQPGWKRHAVIEVNAFGDLLPGVLDQGEETYSAELRALAARRV